MLKILIVASVCIFSQACASAKNDLTQLGNAGLTVKHKITKGDGSAVVIDCEIIYSTGTEKTNVDLTFSKDKDCNVTFLAKVERSKSIESHQIVGETISNQADSVAGIGEKVAKGAMGAFAP